MLGLARPWQGAGRGERLGTNGLRFSAALGFLARCLTLLDDLDGGGAEGEGGEDLGPVDELAEGGGLDGLLGDDDGVAGVDAGGVEDIAPEALGGVLREDGAVGADDEGVVLVGDAVGLAGESQVVADAAVAVVEEDVLAVDGADDADDDGT